MMNFLNKSVSRLSTQRVFLSTKSDRSTKKIGAAGYFFLIAPTTTFCLGVWQYRRRNWKIDLIAELHEKVVTAAPVQLDLEQVEGVEYQRVAMRGKFDHSQEVLIGPRSLIDQRGGAVGGGIISARGDRVGYHVVTPFLLSDSGKRILVNRGWVPRTRLEAATREEGQVEGECSVSGVLRLTEETSSLTPRNDERTNQWHSRDVPALAAKLHTLPVFVDLDLESSRAAGEVGGPIGGQTRISLRNDHVQYMMTWFGVSAVTTLLWLKRFVF